ncbi:MAG: tRNA (5-methylaminomethyl-2-thiouridine)(34)-methyltransferase MnmD [Bacteroidota bacterium]|nr:tRNA (5-methylaminomethyl-2-thiouridine)(34)-methyltransferase MnmD [Bacteroidota bacterium]
MLNNVITADGSSSLYNSELNEHYHSVNGAIQESIHVFIEAGLQLVKMLNLDSINILEIGFGTGLNALLTKINASEHIINYTGIEKYRLSPEITAELNYANKLGEGDFFKAIHKAESNTKVQITDLFNLEIVDIDLVNYKPEFDKYHLIYFDAFAPTIQPELWKTKIFEALFHSLKSGGILTTYCAKGVVRRSLQEVGFRVERIPGPIGKREMLRASKA